MYWIPNPRNTFRHFPFLTHFPTLARPSIEVVVLVQRIVKGDFIFEDACQWVNIMLEVAPRLLTFFAPPCQMRDDSVRFFLRVFIITISSRARGAQADEIVDGSGVVVCGWCWKAGQCR